MKYWSVLPWPCLHLALRTVSYWLFRFGCNRNYYKRPVRVITWHGEKEGPSYISVHTLFSISLAVSFLALSFPPLDSILLTVINHGLCQWKFIKSINWTRVHGHRADRTGKLRISKYGRLPLWYMGVSLRQHRAVCFSDKYSGCGSDRIHLEPCAMGYCLR